MSCGVCVVIFRLVLLFGLLNLKQQLCLGTSPPSIDCSGFRTFYEEDERNLADLSLEKRLMFAAKTGESHVTRMSRRSQTAFVQEGVNLNIDCSLWLDQFPGGSISWRFLQLSESGNVIGMIISTLAACTRDFLASTESLQQTL